MSSDVVIRVDRRSLAKFNREMDKYSNDTKKGVSAEVQRVTLNIERLAKQNVKMADLLVPLSMAILTDYNEDYLGMVDENETPNKQGKENDNDIPGRRGKTKKGHLR